MTSAFLVGYYGFQNAGDEWLRQQATRLLTLAGVSKLSVLAPEGGEGQVPRWRFFAVITAIRRHQVTVLGGGSLFQDTSSVLSFFYYWFLMMTAVFFRKPVLLLGHGLGPVRRRICRAAMAVSGRFNITVWARSEWDAQLFRQFGFQDVSVIADLALIKLTEPPVMDASSSERPKYIGVNLKRKWQRLSLVPLQNESDIAIMGCRFSQVEDSDLGQKSIDIPENYGEMVAASLTEWSGFVTMRYHGVIVAILHQIPVFVIAEDDKLAQMARLCQVPMCRASDWPPKEPILFKIPTLPSIPSDESLVVKLSQWLKY